MVGQVLFNIGDSISKIGYIMAAVLRTKAVYRKYTKCLYLLYAAALVGIALILNVNIRFIALSTTPKFINQKMWFQFPTINQFIFASTVYVVIFDMICAFIFCHAIYSNVLGSTTHPLLRIFGSNDIRRLIMSIVFALGHLIIKEVTEQNDMWIVMGTVVLWITYQQTSFVITSYETTAKVFHAADSAAAGGTKPSATSSSGGTATGTEPLARRPIMTRSIDASNC
ncbi:hypothetical protein DFS34DRAFT_382768 [Phlyctochytrium arcticum]|nr:hypothetical protein DFS34DRAFT_382768 [Phlyctochytrium arcticum]